MSIGNLWKFSARDKLKRNGQGVGERLNVSTGLRLKKSSGSGQRVYCRLGVG